MGATYLDCPNKPCYLCKRPGHTTATCPYRIAPGQGGAAAGAAAGGLGGAGGGRGGRAGGSGGGGLARALMRRECQGGCVGARGRVRGEGVRRCWNGFDRAASGHG